ncbi:nucleoside-diphosphate-sugar epimerase [Polynucleobacter sphagniphilus]|uniref:GDP-mannose 4,6-dehydratase n=1 Tax=Polynucleobacter sphagniphilus TaxID=1743169 RepID=UPI0024767B1D|nr:GDP-mannose 4,6-dehydratase [Polynucleobacter sphagniphilus]MDH6420893.1 nucleoside-diphosphate-sugar epimerase [Polynucleobacter sphagniphilus]
MKILITGVAGFTGLYLTSAAEVAGHHVVSLQADLTNKSAIEAELRQVSPNAVVHLAALSFVGHANDAAFYDVNVIGTMNLLEGLSSLPKRPSCVLLASSANIYGNCEVSPITETQSPSPVNHYAMSKLAMEFMAKTYFDRLPLVITRPFNYTGLGQGSQFLIPKLVAHFSQKAEYIELGNLHVEREFNDVRMVCDAYIQLLTKGVAGEVYNICSGKPFTLKDVILTLERLTGVCLDVRVNPAFARANEVHKLYGSPKKLENCIGPLRAYDLQDTLQWMLKTQ